MMATGSAVRGDLEDGWSWPTREPVREIIPARKGEPAVILLESMIGLDGATGAPRWDGHGSTAVLDPGDSTRPPRVLSESGDATVCRLARPRRLEVRSDRPHGVPISTSIGFGRPRWMRPLPWGLASGGAGRTGLRYSFIPALSPSSTLSFPWCFSSWRLAGGSGASAASGDPGRRRNTDGEQDGVVSAVAPGAVRDQFLLGTVFLVAPATSG